MHIVLIIIAILISLVLVIGVHEMGHALAALIFNVKIKRISIGFGKPLMSWVSSNGIEWVWALWPLGGYVQLLSSRIEIVSPSELYLCIDKKPVWQRLIIFASGAIANLVMAGWALLLMFLLGYTQLLPVIKSVSTPSIAASAHLMPGDQIIYFGQKEVASWQEVGMQFVMNLAARKTTIIVRKPDGEIFRMPIDLSQWQAPKKTESLLKTLGIEPDLSSQYKQQIAGLNFEKAIQKTFNQMVYLIGFFLIIIKHILTGVIPFSFLLGPVGLFTAILDSFFQGFSVFLAFIASFSSAVALINLLPIPGLDGGSMLYALIEKLRGKPISVAFEILIHRLIFIAFSLLLVQLLLNDLKRYIQ